MYKWPESTWNSMQQSFGRRPKVAIKSKPLSSELNHMGRLEVHLLYDCIPQNNGCETRVGVEI